MSANDAQLSAYLRNVPDAPHLAELGRVLDAYSLQFKRNLQSSSRSPISEAQIVAMLLKIVDLYENGVGHAK